MNVLPLTTAEKKAYGKRIGEILVRDYGKKKYYSGPHIKKASQEVKNGYDLHCWAMCLYMSPDEVKAYHDAIGDGCDYSAMKAEMTSALTDGASDSWFKFNMSWLEWPDIELPSIFDIFD